MSILLKEKRSTPLALYKAVKTSSSAFQLQLKQAEKTLAEKVANRVKRSELNVTFIGQVTDEELSNFYEILDKRHSGSYQLYNFKHDGEKPNAILVNILPPPSLTTGPNEAAKEDRAVIKSSEFEDFFAHVLDEKLEDLCSGPTKNAEAFFAKTPEAKSYEEVVSAKELGYDYVATKKAIQQINIGNAKSYPRSVKTTSSGRCELSADEPGDAAIRITVHRAAPKKSQLSISESARDHSVEPPVLLMRRTLRGD